MRAQEFENPKEKFVDMFRKFLPLAMEVIELNSLPKFVFDEKLDTGEQPSFGAYSVDNQTLYVALANRHPNDILRTVAHELVHYKQDTINELNDESGITGSPEENQANQIAGIVMRNFNKRYPEFLSSKPVVLESRQGNENISEKLNRTGSNELVIFDIDDTLLHTTAQIKVIKDGVPVRSLTNQEFNNYKLGPGEEFDFGEFRNAQKFEEESVPIGPMLDKLKQDLAAGKNVVMLTARSDFDNQKAVWRTFKRHGIDINQDVHLFRAGNLPGSESPAVKKAIHVSKWLNTGNYRKIVMYDDSEKNLTVFKSLETKFPDVEFEAHHVSDEGSTRQVEERKKKKIRHAAYGPGPYGWYGYDAGYSGDSGGIEETAINELNTAQTLKFIKQAHGDQLYGNLPYWTHPRAVALTGRKIFGAKFNSNAVKTAFLHDVVEDTHISLDELSKLGFDPQVIEAVGLLTKDKSLTYQQNIAKIINSRNPLAMMVKYADNYENYTGDKSSWASEKAASSQKKYLASLNMLGDKLGVTYHIDENFADGRNQQDIAEAMARNAKEKKLFELLEAWGFFISFKTVDLGKTNAVDQTAKQEIIKMRQHYLGPVLNGMTFGEITKSDLWQNPKVIPHLLKYIYQGIPYIEERIKKFVVPSEQQRYLSTIDKIKTLYREVVAQYSGQQGVVENFADGRNPQDKGDSARHGIRKGISIAQLKKIRSSKTASPRKKQLAHWQINMRQGRKK